MNLVPDAAASAGTGLTLELFGGPQVLSAGARIHLSPKQTGLLCFVFGEGGVSRARAIWVLWKANADTKSRRRLRQLLYQITARLGHRVIDGSGDQLRPLPNVACDLVVFSAALSDGSLLKAAELFRTGFLANAPEGIGGDFEKWASTAKSTMRARLTKRSLAKWEESAFRRHWGAARDAAECLYVLRPMDPVAVQRVIEARARAGKDGAAEAAYATYLETLPDATPPSPDVESVMERVRTIRATPASSSTTKRTTGRSQAPFIGRESELALGNRALDRIASGELTVTLITGEAGIGKTRLLEELAREAALRGFRCLRANAVELEQRIPLNPLLDALNAVDLHPHLEALGPPWSTVIGAELPAGAYRELVGERPPIQQSNLSRRLLDAFSLLFERLALERSTVLLLDDLHWADATTVSALQFFQRRWSVGSFGIVGALRSNAVRPGDPVHRYLTEAPELPSTRIDLVELSRPEARQLVTIVAGRPIEAAQVDRICDLAGLHPLYLTELTRDLLAGQLSFPEVSEDQVPIPVSLQQIFTARIAELSEGAGRMAGILAVVGRPIRLSDMAELGRITLEASADYAEELERCGLARTDRDTISIVHDLFRSALYKHLSTPRRALIHGSVAEWLLESETDAPGELAIHYAKAGESAAAAESGWIAARRAWESGAMAEAAHLFELVADNQADVVRRAEATALFAQSLHLNRDLARATHALERAAARLREVGDPVEARRMEIRRVDSLDALGTTPLKDLQERLVDVKNEALGDQDWEAVALTLNAELQLLNRADDHVGIRRVFDELRATARRGSRAASILSYAGLAMEVLFGDPVVANQSARRAVALASKEDEHRLMALTRLLVVLQHQGMLLANETESVLLEARELARASGDRRAQFAIEGNVVLALIDAGELDRAEAAIEESNRLLGSPGMGIYEFNQVLNLAELSLARGEFEEARGWFTQAAQTLQTNAPAFTADLVNAGLGLCALEMGDLTEARRRESALNEPPPLWFYDPTTVLSFRARLRERRGAILSAIELLLSNLEDLRERNVMAWLKLTSLLVRLMLKARDPAAARWSQAGREVAASLRLERWSQLFELRHQTATDRKRVHR